MTNKTQYWLGEIRRLELLVKEYEHLEMPKMATRYRIQLAAARMQLVDSKL